jgi:hypothetical protein
MILVITTIAGALRSDIYGGTLTEIAAGISVGLRAG